MVNDTLELLTEISDDKSINMENYLESLFYCDNVTRIDELLEGFKKFAPKVKLLPSFRGKETCEKHNLPYTEEESRLMVAKFQFPPEFAGKDDPVSMLTKTLIESGNEASVKYERRSQWDKNGVLTVHMLKNERKF